MTYRSEFVTGLARLTFIETRDRLKALHATALKRGDPASLDAVSTAESEILLAYKRTVENLAAALDKLDGVAEEAAPAPVAKPAGPVLPGRMPPRVAGSPPAPAAQILPVRTPPKTPGGPVLAPPGTNPKYVDPITGEWLVPTGGKPRRSLADLEKSKAAEAQPEPTAKAEPVKAPFRYPPKKPAPEGHKPLGPVADDDDIPW